MTSGMTTSAPPRTVRDLTGMLMHAGHVLTTRLTAALAEIGITPRDQCVLWHAAEAERTQIQLAELADLDKTTMVVTIDKLERAGYAERRPSSTDRRARIISVTEEGLRIVAEGAKIVDRVHAEVLAALPEGERQAFVDALMRLVGGPLSEPEEGGGPVRRSRQAR
ncbi:MarR family winged helix-turn-helix transcriptional regulator [Streptosporangium sandarakinum]|uniref:MarR family winged helix-turn-helix transcriptional regulator n=1 Tax=Streptosporangium sandarakinum TaxID=1260955 RepID=UPI003421E18A